MKFVILQVLFAVVAVLPQSAYSSGFGKTRILKTEYHPNAMQIMEILKEVDLERFGFNKTTEIVTEKDENGKTTEKKTLHYKVTDDCSKIKYWKSILEERMPKGWKKWSGITVVNRRIVGGKTNQCEFGLEFHPKGGFPQQMESDKRSMSKSSYCYYCYCSVCYHYSVGYYRCYCSICCY